MKMVQLFTFLFILLLSTTCYGQTPPAPTYNLPDQVPPPADAASLGKYGDLPINMSSGVPDITIPFYEIKTGKLSLPISLSYDASGIKVDQIASWVGLGFSLNAGGVITRTVNGGDDLAGGSGYFQEPIPPIASIFEEYNDSTWNYLETATFSQGNDTKPDYFFYNFSGHTGQFVFGEDKNPIDLHHQEPLKIQYTQLNGVYTFNILDGTGNQYIFSAPQTDHSYGQSGTGGMVYASSWYLTQIISCDMIDTITFSYYTDRQLIESSFNYKVTINDFLPTPQLISQGLSGESYLASNPLRLQSITFKNGKVVFFSSGPRNDVAENKLDSIVVNRYDFQSKTYLPIKTLQFNYGYYKSKFNQADTSYRLRLDSFRISGTSGEDGGNYSFTYNQNQLPLLHSLGRDLFNYYNGKDNNTTLIPNSAISSSEMNQLGLQLADRNTYDSYLESGILLRIYYPTSGYTAFTYEPNQYKQQSTGTKNASAVASTGSEIRHSESLFTPTKAVTADVYFNISAYAGGPITSGALYQGTTVVATVYVDPYNGVNQHQSIQLAAGVQYKLVADAPVNSTRSTSAYVSATWSEPDTTIQIIGGGGLRVAYVNEYDQSGNFLKGKKYKYGVGENGYGQLPSGAGLFNTFNKETNIYWGQVVDDGDVAVCVPHFYTYNVLSSSSIYDCFNLSAQAISYPEVAEYQVDQAGTPLGKSVYDFTIYQPSYIIGNLSTPSVINSGYEGGKLLAKADYSYKNAIYQPVRRMYITYNNILGPQGRTFSAERQYNMSGCFVDGYGGTINHYWNDFIIYSGTVLPNVQTTLDYDINDTTKFVTNSLTYTYNTSAHLQPITITEAMSDGTSTVTTDQYPEEKTGIANLSVSESGALDQMIQMHDLTPIIQKSVQRNNIPVSVVRTDYKVWNTYAVYPDSVEVQNYNFPIENRLIFLSYDGSGNLLQGAKVSDANHTYIWDYNNEYPIAEATNASQADIAAISFEADGKGNWTFSGMPSNAGGAITGTQSYSLSSGSISKSGLTSATKYIISYWSKGSVSVSGGTQSNSITGKTVNGWAYHEVMVTGTTSVSISGSTYIDELRLYPSTAQMVTYTYEPLIGMTSQCDVDNKIKYYEYDALGRLQDIKDQDGNILKTFEYHYQQSAQQ